jgi:alpha-L-fucosidase
MLNVGPRADGTIPDVMSNRLEGMGRWLKINGQSIYRTTPWSQPSDDDNADVRFTVGKRGNFYVTALTWPGKELTVNANIPVPRNARITLLGSDGRALKYRRVDGKLVVTMPKGGDQLKATSSRHAFVLRIAGPPRSGTRQAGS